jgi:hypothetical protein
MAPCDLKFSSQKAAARQILSFVKLSFRWKSSFTYGEALLFALHLVLANCKSELASKPPPSFKLLQIRRCHIKFYKFGFKFDRQALKCHIF